MKNIILPLFMLAISLLIQVQTNFAQPECAAADTHFTNGKNLVEQGKFKDAQAEFSIYVGCNPQKFEGYSQRARAEVLANDLDAAMADANKALALNPQDANAFNVRGLVNKNNKNFAAAIKDFTDAIRLEPSNPKAYFNRSSSYAAMNDVEKAMVDINKAIELAPTVSRTYVQRGLLYFSAQNWAAAEKDFSQAIKLGENTAFIYMNRGAANHNLANYDQAVADDRKALELDPNNAAAKKNLELSLAKQTPKVQPNVPNQTGDALAISIDDCHKKGDFACMVQLASKGIELYPTNEDFYFFRGAGFLGLKKYDEAIIDLTKVLVINPKYSEASAVYQFRGVAYFSLHNYEFGEADFKKALEINPENKTVASYLDQIPRLKYDEYIAKLDQASDSSLEKAFAVAKAIQVPENTTNICNAIKNQDSEFKIEELYVHKIQQLLNNGELDKFPNYKKQAQELPYIGIEGTRTALNNQAARYGCKLN